MGLLEDCRNFFKTEDLYEVLHTSKEASQADLKKAYKKMSLAVHPDRADASHIKEATRKFQILSKVHFVLSDADRRAIYDETGEVEDEYVEKEKNWTEYWRLLFPRITIKDIEHFMKNYKGSEEERENLKKCYLDCEGDMNTMCNYILGYNQLEEERYRSVLQEMIDNEDIPDFPAFTKESAAKKRKRQKKYEKEAAEAEELSKELNLTGGEDSLVAAITKRQNERHQQLDDMLSNLAQKYGKKPKNRKTK